jgi:hypothetical protein
MSSATQGRDQFDKSILPLSSNNEIHITRVKGGIGV